MEGGIAEVITLSFIFCSLIAAVTLALIWSSYPVKSMEQGRSHLRTRLLYFALTGLRENNKDFCLIVLENMLNIREHPIEKLVKDHMSFWGIENFSVVFRLENREIRICRGELEHPVEVSGSFPVFPAWSETPLLMRLEVRA